MSEPKFGPAWLPSHLRLSDWANLSTPYLQAEGASSPLIVALDVDDPSKARQLAEELLPYDVRWKVGLEYTTALGVPKALEPFTRPRSVMLDLKLHDIPNTMWRALRAAAKNPAVWGVTLHASAGREALTECIKCAADEGVLPIVITVLTSLDDRECLRIYGDRPWGQALEFTDFIFDAAVAATRDIAARPAAPAPPVGTPRVGVVCSPKEVAGVHARLTERTIRGDCVLITPGVRPVWSQGKDDQARSASPLDAMKLGADFIVVGRPISQALGVVHGPAARAAAILLELAGHPVDPTWPHSLERSAGPESA